MVNGAGWERAARVCLHVCTQCVSSQINDGVSSARRLSTPSVSCKVKATSAVVTFGGLTPHSRGRVLTESVTLRRPGPPSGHKTRVGWGRDGVWTTGGREGRQSEGGEIPTWLDRLCAWTVAGADAGQGRVTEERRGVVVPGAVDGPRGRGRHPP